MRILISGGTGLTGSYLVPYLQNLGHRVTVLTTRRSSNGDTASEFSFWNPKTSEIDTALFSRHDCVINLAGANVGERWTTKHRAAIMDSRVYGTSLLARCAAAESSMVKTFISLSATGIYAANGAPCNENGPLADDSDFLAGVCKQWEAASNGVADKMQKVTLRLGIVLSPRGGILGKLLPLFKTGLGASIGNGRQYISWIHPEDFCRIIQFVIERPHISGVINATAPRPVTMRDFAQTLAKTLRKPLWLPPVFGWQLRLIGGEGAMEALKSFHVTSEVLPENGFEFKFETASAALADLLPAE